MNKFCHKLSKFLINVFNVEVNMNRLKLALIFSLGFFVKNMVAGEVFFVNLTGENVKTRIKIDYSEDTEQVGDRIIKPYGLLVRNFDQSTSELDISFGKHSEFLGLNVDILKNSAQYKIEGGSFKIKDKNLTDKSFIVFIKDVNAYERPKEEENNKKEKGFFNGAKRIISTFKDKVVTNESLYYSNILKTSKIEALSDFYMELFVRFENKEKKSRGFLISGDSKNKLINSIKNVNYVKKQIKDLETYFGNEGVFEEGAEKYFNSNDIKIEDKKQKYIKMLNCLNDFESSKKNFKGTFQFVDKYTNECGVKEILNNCEFKLIDKIKSAVNLYKNKFATETFEVEDCEQKVEEKKDNSNKKNIEKKAKNKKTKRMSVKKEVITTETVTKEIVTKEKIEIKELENSLPQTSSNFINNNKDFCCFIEVVNEKNKVSEKDFDNLFENLEKNGKLDTKIEEQKNEKQEVVKSVYDKNSTNSVSKTVTVFNKDIGTDEVDIEGNNINLNSDEVDQKKIEDSQNKEVNVEKQEETKEDTLQEPPTNLLDDYETEKFANKSNEVENKKEEQKIDNNNVKQEKKLYAEDLNRENTQEEIELLKKYIVKGKDGSFKDKIDLIILSKSGHIELFDKNFKDENLFEGFKKRIEKATQDIKNGLGNTTIKDGLVIMSAQSFIDKVNGEDFKILKSKIFMPIKRELLKQKSNIDKKDLTGFVKGLYAKSCELDIEKSELRKLFGGLVDFGYKATKIKFAPKKSDFKGSILDEFKDKMGKNEVKLNNSKAIKDSFGLKHLSEEDKKKQQKENQPKDDHCYLRSIFNGNRSFDAEEERNEQIEKNRTMDEKRKNAMCPDNNNKTNNGKKPAPAIPTTKPFLNKNNVNNNNNNNIF